MVLLSFSLLLHGMGGESARATALDGHGEVILAVGRDAIGLGERQEALHDGRLGFPGARDDEHGFVGEVSIAVIHARVHERGLFAAVDRQNPIRPHLPHHLHL